MTQYTNLPDTLKSALPPGYHLQVVYDENGIPSTVPLGTSVEGNCMGPTAILWRGRIALALEKLFVDQFGYAPRDYMVLNCSDPQGNEMVFIRGKIRPPKETQLKNSPELPKLPSATSTSDVIDI